MDILDLERFLAAYIDCALWSSNDESDESGGDPLDQNYSATDLSPEALIKMRADCQVFIRGNLTDLKDFDPTQAGHDFWLTRNGHGAGFWDRDLGALGDRLTASCEAFGECDLYVGDDGFLYVSP